MKISLAKLFFGALAAGAGWELGRTLPHVGAKLCLNKGLFKRQMETERRYYTDKLYTNPRRTYAKPTVVPDSATTEPGATS